jgi:hypothetical protein
VRRGSRDLYAYFCTVLRKTRNVGHDPKLDWLWRSRGSCRGDHRNIGCLSALNRRSRSGTDQILLSRAIPICIKSASNFQQPLASLSFLLQELKERECWTLRR